MPPGDPLQRASTPRPGQYQNPGGRPQPYGWTGGYSPFGSGYSPGAISGYGSFENMPANEGGWDDFTIGRNNALYNFENPSAAFDNVLRDRGLNPNLANPFMQSIRSMAPGMANAYITDRAMLPGQGVTTGADYRNFLGAVLDPSTQGQTAAPSSQGPALQGSQFYATLGNSAARMPDLIRATRGFDPQNVNNVNPFLAAAQERMAAGGGQGGIDMLMSFYGPQMSRGVRSAYSNALDTALGNATRGFWNQPQGNRLGTDIYTYLFGV